MITQRILTASGVMNEPPNRSLEFTAANNESLELSNSDWGSYDRSKWAFSCWGYRKVDSGTHTLFSKYGSSSATQEILIAFDFNRSITVITRNATTDGIILTTTYGADGNGFESDVWYHVYVTFDTSRAAADVLQLIVDGTRVTDIASETQPVGNVSTTTTSVRLGQASSGLWPADAYIYQPAFFSGVIPAVGDFINGSSPDDIRGATGLHSLLHTTDSSTLEADEEIIANWTNNNTVVKSTLVP